MNIGENIKKYRKEKGFTQSQLSKLSDIPVITLGRYERGERNPSIDILNKIALALGVQINQLCSTESFVTRATFEKFMNDNNLSEKEFMELVKNNPNLTDEFEKPDATKEFMTDENFDSKMVKLKAFNRIEAVLKAYNIHFAFKEDENSIVLVDKNDHFSNDISPEYFKSFIFKLNELIENEIEYFKIIQALNRANAIEANDSDNNK